MRVLRGLALAAGLIVLLVLVVRSGADSVWTSIRAVSPAQLALLCLIYGVSQVLDTIGWRCAFARARVPFLRLLAARSAGEAVNAVTVLGGVGGEPVKAWPVSDEASKEESVASVIIAKTAITAAQLVLLFVGTVLAVTTLDLDGLVVRAMLGLLVVESLAVGGFFALQVTGVIGKSHRLLSAVGVPTAGVHVHRLDRALRRYYTQEWPRFLASVAWHFAGWLVAVVEAAYALHLVGAGSALSIAAAHAHDVRDARAPWTTPAGEAAEIREGIEPRPPAARFERALQPARQGQGPAVARARRREDLDHDPLIEQGGCQAVARQVPMVMERAPPRGRFTVASTR